MKFFLDTEFIEDGKTIDLISLGVVSEDGKEFYVQNLDCDFSRASEWVRRNVLMQLPEFDIGPWKPAPKLDAYLRNGVWLRHDEIGTKFLNFIHSASPYNYERTKHEKPEFWGWYSDYDWVVVAQLFGPMVLLPKEFPQFCMDIKQMAVMQGNPNVKEAVPLPEGVHNALEDAKWNKKVYEWLKLSQLV